MKGCMMATLLLGECFPFRNVDKENVFNNSQGRLLASSIGLHLNELQSIVDCDYLMHKYYSSKQRKSDWYFQALSDSWKMAEKEYRHKYDVIIAIGKRISFCILRDQLEFFSLVTHHSFTIGVVPNPLAELWWNKQQYVEETKHFFNYILKYQHS
jgi:hypothetical protein